MDMKDVRAAAGEAIRFTREVFGDQDIADLLLEEVRYDEMTGEWDITVGFGRSVGMVLPDWLQGSTSAGRVYKVVRVGADLRAKEVRNWVPDAA